MANYRTPLINDFHYHIINRSIAKYRIFSKKQVCERFVRTIGYYQTYPQKLSLSKYLENKYENSTEPNKDSSQQDKLVEIIAYCLMPTHFHLILKQKVNNGISTYMSKVENSFTKYFNILNGRKGTLWEDNFKRILIESDEQLLHLTRYIHLNPVSAGLVAMPEYWDFSSYKEYLTRKNNNDGICNFRKIINIEPANYMKFVVERIEEQKQLSIIKSQNDNNYSG
ncbi:MAG: hypothetical protein UR93_C0015G0006 [Berkelbacteria bacterium GW2011_GWA2_35_9]|uniref:Transposase IS200-like domain-containing protein n=1 Tax=Berkelbacteria bacterium GW2011_GWA2_35_9 TaxID=1618333 RepID=A0A0G0DI18_9BACT|nr:MAG: hypothetical protein UR93_C0015G0006 [Berkelbacteria bacterium GW2011_GWA2_35_9]